MFPSMNNSYYPLFYNENLEIVNNNINNNSYQHHQEFCNNNSLIPPILQNQLVLEAPINNHNNNPSISSKRGVGKRDRHTKICTAQGIRDRRVRLSINIAREFFNLQDLLGFDKASKTLGWLMDKSKEAIEELNSANNKTNDAVSSSNINEINEDGVDELRENAKFKKLKKREYCNGQSIALEITRLKRANARDRARERTIIKNKIRNNHINLECLDYQNLMFHHQSILNHGFNKDVSVGESIVVKNKSRESSHHQIYNYNHNYDLISKDYEVSYNANGHHNDHDYGGLTRLLDYQL